MSERKHVIPNEALLPEFDSFDRNHSRSHFVRGQFVFDHSKMAFAGPFASKNRATGGAQSGVAVLFGSNLGLVGDIPCALLNRNALASGRGKAAADDVDVVDESSGNV